MAASEAGLFNGGSGASDDPGDACRSSASARVIAPGYNRRASGPPHDELTIDQHYPFAAGVLEPGLTRAKAACFNRSG